MTQQLINIGTTPNDGTGDPIRTCFSKTNSNFTELYTNKVESADLASITDSAKGTALVGFLRTGAGWVGRTLLDKIRESAYSVMDAGAVGDGVTDDTAAVSLAIQYGLAANKAVYFPAGTYRLASRIVKSGTLQKTTLFGDGIGLSKILVDNFDGGIAFNSTDRKSEIQVRDLEFIANKKGAGIGLAITMPEGGNNHQRSAYLHNIKVGVANENDAVNYAYFGVAIDLSGTWHALVDNVFVLGPWGPGISSNLDDTSPIYSTLVGIDLDGAYGPDIRHSTIDGVRIAISNVSANDPGPEHFRMTHCQLVSVRVGLLFTRPAREPTLWINNCHINYRNQGFNIEGAKLINITNCIPYNEDTTAFYATPTDISLSNVEFVNIHNNEFHFNGNPARVCISIAGVIYARHINIAENIFSALGTYAVDVGSSVQSIQILNNSFPGTFTGGLVNDQSGAALIVTRGDDGQILQTLQKDDASTGPEYVLYRKSASPNAGDNLGAVVFRGNDSAGNSTDYATTLAEIANATNGAEESSLAHFVYENGAQVRAIGFDAGAATTNNTALLLRTNKAGVTTFERVTVGAIDSGGVGYRVLRVAN